MNPYQPPVPGAAFPPPQPLPGEGPSQNRCVVWLVLSVVSFICGCGILAIIPIALSIAALVKRATDPKLALTLNRFARGCVIAGYAVLILSVVLNVVMAAMAS